MLPTQFKCSTKFRLDTKSISSRWHTKNTTEPKKLVSWGSSGEIRRNKEDIFPVTLHPKQKFVRRMIKWAKKKDMW